MIRNAVRRAVDFLGSAAFGTTLLAILGVWSMLATLVPQAGSSPGSATEIATWASKHAALEPIVRAIGLHQAFSNPLFMAVVALLGVSTAICAWERTKIGLRRGRVLRDAAGTDSHSLAENHDFEVPCGPGFDASAALSVGSETLRDLGVRTRRRGDLLLAVSPRWTVLGSPIFHWSLLALVLVFLLAGLLRSEGLMGVAVGQTKPDSPRSYGILHVGPLHDWGLVRRSIRVDKFEPDYRTGGVDRGPTPTVSLLDGAGQVIKKQRVYPNMTLTSGPLSIYPSAYGLAAKVSVLDTNGALVGRGVQLIDLPNDSTGRTIAVGGIAAPDFSGALVNRATVTVSLNETWRNRIPEDAAAHIVVTSPDGSTVTDQIIPRGGLLIVPGGGSLRLDDIVYYARLQVVDDWTIPLLYGWIVVALSGLAVATLTRQQIVLVTVVEGADGVKLVAKVRFWRNSSTSRSEVQSALVAAFSGTEDRRAA